MELEKKDKVISKLNKEKLQMEEENVKLNILNMKYLNQIEKVKGNGNFNYKNVNAVNVNK